MESFSSLDEGDQQVKHGGKVWPVCNHHYTATEQQQHSFAHVSCLHTVMYACMHGNH